MNALETVQTYYRHFNNRNFEGMISLLDSTIRHEPNQGTARIGKDLFREFMVNMEKRTLSISVTVRPLLCLIF